MTAPDPLPNAPILARKLANLPPHQILQILTPDLKEPKR